MTALYDFFISLFYTRYCPSYRDFWRLRKLYRKKKKGFTMDIRIPVQDGIFQNSIKVMRIRIPLESGAEGVYCLYEVERFIHRHVVEGARYDLIGCDDLKPIRSCTIKEFIQLYGRIL